MGVKRRQPRRPVRRSAAGSTATATKAVLIAFERWYARHLVSVGDDHLPTDRTVALLSDLFDRSRGALHAPTAPVLEGLLAGIDDDPERAGELPDVIQTLEHYLDFAVETGSWSGTDDEIDESAELLEVAFELSTALLGFLVDSLDEVEDVPVDRARAALETLAPPLRTPEALLGRLRDVLGGVDSTEPGDVAVQRVIGLLCVAVDPGLLPERSEKRIQAMLDTAAGATVDQARMADVDTTRMLALLEGDGLIERVKTSGIDRFETPEDLRPALADAVVEIADELGLLDDDVINPHPAGTALQVKVAVVGTEPAEWRRLLLAAESDLGELHLAAQLSLDWPNEEPHEFTVAGEPDTVFTSFGRVTSDASAGAGVGVVADTDDAEDDRIDENDVQLGELLIDVGDEIEYRYGVEPRRLVIRLERIGEPDGGPLPRCVGATAGIDLVEADGLLASLRLR
ncbi:plasmid pRiA4b ORF-3 family protein [Herbiconiux sp. CPCC 205763]|uniref:Plasmid pRiA4b ORF-3 family protein n=1 Tax=Herbiconiux aconitum TaxID=2970913 RepID=A0ABT2GTE7_9MICO|nr:plasmid pRiA4b ORF-3 family protein [Herbiconiux aconitum]MCS5719453.1 plasmid pRiA4b ORF-3 family protein [Herbiconiux aconitum]